MTPIRFHPRYSWAVLRSDIIEAYGRAMAQLDWAMWDAELVREGSIA